MLGVTAPVAAGASAAGAFGAGEPVLVPAFTGASGRPAREPERKSVEVGIRWVEEEEMK